MSLQVPSDRYEEDEKEKGLNYEQAKWEEEHLKKALTKFGAKDAKDRAREKVTSRS